MRLGGVELLIQPLDELRRHGVGLGLAQGAFLDQLGCRAAGWWDDP
jgi:hypothetical protein